MFISKFSHLGARVVKRLITAPSVSAPRTTYSYAVQDRNLQSLMLERFFSTTDRAQEKGSEENQKISVTFVGSDGEETNIKVPIGMSMLEAAHENDIELEGGSKIYALGASIGPTVGVDILLAARDHITQHGNLKFATAHSRACEGSLACSTCHVIVMDMEYYNKLEDPSDEENDMLDLAFGLTETSRLGCQVIAKPELDGLRLALPAATRNFAVDGYKPKPH